MQHHPRRRDDLRPDGIQGPHRSVVDRQWRFVPPAEAADPSRLDLRCRGTGRAGVLFRRRDQGLRPDRSGPRAAYARYLAGRTFRLDLWNRDRRHPSRHRPAFHHHRAPNRGLGRHARPRRQHGDVFPNSTATRSTARPRSPRRGMASMSIRPGSIRKRAGRGSGAAARASLSITASAPTTPS